MKIKNQNSVKSLQDIRSEGINEIQNRTSIQAHGKLFGHDTFSWHAPNIDELHSFLESIPYSVFIVGEPILMNELSNCYPTIDKKYISKIELKDPSELKSKINLIKTDSDQEFMILICGISNEFKLEIEEFKTYSHLL